MLDITLQLGLPIKEFWDMTLDEVAMYVAARSKDLERERRHQLMMYYTLARDTASFVALSFNGKKIPTFDDLYPELEEMPLVEEEPEDSENDWKLFQASMIQFAARHNKNIERGK